jgi:hypothetical protein
MQEARSRNAEQAQKKRHNKWIGKSASNSNMAWSVRGGGRGGGYKSSSKKLPLS